MIWAMLLPAAVARARTRSKGKNDEHLNWTDVDGEYHAYHAHRHQEYHLWIDNYTNPKTGKSMIPMRHRSAASPPVVEVW
ncbi:MAG: hypothetical protein SPK00_05215 [Corynebacterium glucuronolyticum]|nr:hypothetical protein [Corynebacterium glucuronolyticum]MDD7586282.1 hypothetical protein [Mycobacteriaceae bacterium]MDY5834132.1 hypothetical protein [Corynebacterium glucuronolyticum]